MKSGASDHPKMHRLARLLNIPRYAAWGLMEGLWNFTAKYAPAGNVGKFPNQDISDALAWDGEPDILINALVESGWLDRHETERLIIHDWHDHAPDYLKKRAKKGEFIIFGKHPTEPVEQGESVRNLPEKKDQPEGSEKNLPENSGKFQNLPEKNGLPSPTKPSPTQPYPTQPSLPEAVAPASEPAEAKPAEPAAAVAPGNSQPGESGSSPGDREPARSAPTPGTPSQTSVQPPSAGGVGEKSPRSDLSADKQRTRLMTAAWQEVARILKLDPLTADEDAYTRSAQVIIRTLNRLYDDAVSKGKPWDGKRGRMALIRDYARQARKDGKEPIALWLFKCRKEWPWLEIEK